LAAATAGGWLLLVLLGCGAIELARALHGDRIEGRGLLGAWAWPAVAERIGPRLHSPARWPLLALGAAPGGAPALAWSAFKVGALAFGGGFVIVPLMQADAVDTYHWMSHAQFLNAVALGQVTPGPVTHTVAAVGYAAGGFAGALLATFVAFTPSFAFVLLGAPRFERLLRNERAAAFLRGAAPAAAGAIIGSAVPLSAALAAGWQYAVLAAAAAALLIMRRGVVETLVLAGCLGVAAALLGAPIEG
jgi:chromate transporter